MKNDKVIAAIAPAFTELMIQKMKNLKTDWKKPWIATAKGRPRNLSGRMYCGGNILTLLLLTELRKYKAPIFLTFKQAQEEQIAITKGEKSFPVYFWFKYAVPKDPESEKKGMTYEQYLKLDADLRKAYRILLSLRFYSVFNIDQTDLAQKQPQRYAKLMADADDTIVTDGFSCPEIDTMIAGGGWLCPISVQDSDRAYYSPSLDQIVCPLKAQFPEGAGFYLTLLHEMAHSTGHESRLKRDFSGGFGSPSYAREELIAELSSALCGAALGIAPIPREENAAYLDNWLSALAEKPEYLFNVLIDANKAATMIADQIEQVNTSPQNQAQ